MTGTQCEFIIIITPKMKYHRLLNSSKIWFTPPIYIFGNISFAKQSLGIMRYIKKDKFL